MQLLKHEFLLDPEIIYLNHGSYGATPRPVFEAYQSWQRRLEREPVQFITREILPLLRQSRRRLGAYLNADPDDLVYVPNATFGVNVVARSLPLRAGDEVLATDHEYGAVENAWSYACGQCGARYVRQPISFPADCEAAMIDELWQGVTERTKVIFVSHITSPTALRLPVSRICERAREAGIWTVIDGAHAPGQMPLDLQALGADFYVGNCHKWLCAPKGAGFLFTRRDLQNLIEPLVVGWGWGENRRPAIESPYIESLQWLGVDDLSAYLSVPDAIEFQKRHHWPDRRALCHGLLKAYIARLSEVTGMTSPYSPDGRAYEQMAVAPLPRIEDLSSFTRLLYEKYNIEVPGIEWNGAQFIRISVQVYNSEEDLDHLLNALCEALRLERP